MTEPRPGLIRVSGGSGSEDGQSSSSSEDDSDSGSSGDSSGASDGSAGQDNDGDSGSDHASGDTGSSSSNDSDSDSGSSPVDTVSNVNPGGEGMTFNSAQNEALLNAEPLNIIQWSVAPALSFDGELVAEGMLEGNALLFDPTDGDGAAFAVFYKGHEDPMVVLLPDLGPMFQWDTFQTIAPTEHEIEGQSFKLRAYSPLFRDTVPSDLEFRVYGYDENGKEALFAAQELSAQ